MPTRASPDQPDATAIHAGSGGFVHVALFAVASALVVLVAMSMVVGCTGLLR